jgi:hypothetical protein
MGIRMKKLFLTLLILTLTTKILESKDLNHKSVLGDWNIVDKNYQVLGKIRIQEVSDSIEIYKEDSFGNFLKETTFSKIPIKSGPKGIEFENKMIKVNGRDTTRTLETFSFTNGKNNSFDCWYFIQSNVPVNHEDWTSYTTNYWGGKVEKNKLITEVNETKNGNDFSMNDITGVNWKLTSQDGQKGEVKFSIKNDTLYVTLKNKETKNKWKTQSTQMTTENMNSFENEIKFDKTRLSEGSIQETEEENKYIVTEDITFSKLDHNHFRVVYGYFMRPMKITEDNKYNQSTTKKISEIKK